MKSTFHFKDNKKSFQFKLFMNSENTGCKVSPDEAHQEMQQYFQPEDNYALKQIRSLFSKWLKQKRSGSLKDIEKDTSENGKKVVKFIT